MKRKKSKAGPKKSIEARLKKTGFDFVAGIDEAGRGPLAGPVVASAVVLKKSSFKNRIDDSKKLSQAQRERAFEEILKKAHVGIGVVPEGVIDQVNILNATIIAMQKAIRSLMKHKFKNICFIVDGRVKLNIKHYHENILKADQKSISVACASIVAKVTRDKIMGDYDKIFPQYGFSKHKGYGTSAHFKNLKKFGPAKIHRKTFYPVSEFFKKEHE